MPYIRFPLENRFFLQKFLECKIEAVLLQKQETYFLKIMKFTKLYLHKLAMSGSLFLTLVISGCMSLEEKARNGDAQAQYELAVHYEHDLLLPETAIVWYKKAGENGHAEACHRLGNYYHYNIGESGLDWFQKAADLGHPEAQYKMWRYTRSMDDLVKSAKSGYEPAKKALEGLQKHSNEVLPSATTKQQPDAAKEASKEFTEKRRLILAPPQKRGFCDFDPDYDFTYNPLFLLGGDLVPLDKEEPLTPTTYVILPVPEDWKKMTLSSELISPPRIDSATTSNAKEVVQEKEELGVSPDPEEAFKRIKDAAEEGDWEARINIALRYWYGIGVKPNKEAARHWAQKCLRKWRYINDKHIDTLKTMYYNWNLSKDFTNPGTRLELLKFWALSDPRAQYDLGIYYSDRDPLQAIEYFSCAATAQRHPDAARKRYELVRMLFRQALDTANEHAEAFDKTFPNTTIEYKYKFLWGMLKASTEKFCISYSDKQLFDLVFALKKDCETPFTKPVPSELPTKDLKGRPLTEVGVQKILEMRKRNWEAEKWHFYNDKIQESQENLNFPFVLDYSFINAVLRKAPSPQKNKR